jgi:hypothetical protein
MKFVWQRIWDEDRGVLSFEWVLIITLLVIGVIGGLSAARDAIIIEAVDVAGAAASLNQSYEVGVSKKYGLGTTFSYTDTQPTLDITGQDGTTRHAVSGRSCKK